jgi:hypothetical protein
VHTGPAIAATGSIAGWEPQAAQFLLGHMRELPLLEQLNWNTETRLRAHLIDALRANTKFALPEPRLRPEVGVCATALDTFARIVEREAHGHSAWYAARARELAATARAASTLDPQALTTLYPGPHTETVLYAHNFLKTHATDLPCATEPGAHPNRSEALRIKFNEVAAPLGFDVRLAPDLRTYAAVGEATVYVAANLCISESELGRVFVHEYAGHMLPRHAAKQHAIPLLRVVGSANAQNAQEGYATWCELRAGRFDRARHIELSARVLATAAMLDGASAVDCARAVDNALGGDAAAAARITLRVYRGARHGKRGLGREYVYLEGLLALQAAPALAVHVAKALVSYDLAAELSNRAE